MWLFTKNVFLNIRLEPGRSEAIGCIMPKWSGISFEYEGVVDFLALGRTWMRSNTPINPYSGSKGNNSDS